MATTIKLKNGTGAPSAGDLVVAEPALDLTNKRLYTEDSGGTVIEVGTNPTSITTGTVTADGLTVNSGATSTTVNFENSGTAYSTLYNDTNGVAIFSADAGNTGAASRMQFNVGGQQAFRITDGGDISFYEDTGTTAKLFWDASAESLGIGTSSPSGLAHIYSSSSGATAGGGGDELILESSATTGLSILSGTSNDGNILFGDSGNSAIGYVQYKHADNALAFGSNASERMRIDSSGNVGIGTSSPTVAGAAFTGLEINGNGANRGASLVLQDGNGNANLIYTGDTSSSFSISADDNLRIRTNAAERMRIDSSGNVGIGTDNPLRGLDLRTAASGFGNTFLVDTTSGTTGTGGGVIFGSDDGQGTDVSVAAIQGIKENSTAGNQQGALLFVTKNSIAQNTERMRIDSSGNVGINTVPTRLSSNAHTLNVKAGVTSKGGALLLESSDESLRSYFYPTSTGTQIGTLTNHDFLLMTNSTERMRIDSSGNLLVGTTLTAPTTGGVVLYKDSTRGIVRAGTSITTADAVAAWYNPNGKVGQIVTSGSSTSYNTNSDYRLKENVVPLTGATERLKQLNPSRFNFIEDADTTVDGFLAHEVSDVVPEAVTGTKDAMLDEEYEVTPAVLDDDGNVVTEAVMGTRSVPDYQGIDQSKLVPLLVATIQELEARITALESN